MYSWKYEYNIFLELFFVAALFLFFSHFLLLISVNILVMFTFFHLFHNILELLNYENIKKTILEMDDCIFFYDSK